MATRAARRRLGAELTRRREALDPPLNRKDFAAAIGVTPPTALGYERGEYMPAADKLAKIAAVLKCTTDELLAAMAPPARAAKLAAVALLVGALIAACGSSSSPPAPDAAVVALPPTEPPPPACIGCDGGIDCDAAGDC